MEQGLRVLRVLRVFQALRFLLCSFDKYLQWLSAIIVTCNEPTIMDDCVQRHGTAEIKLLETKARREIL